MLDYQVVGTLSVFQDAETLPRRQMIHLPSLFYTMQNPILPQESKWVEIAFRL